MWVLVANVSGDLWQQDRYTFDFTGSGFCTVFQQQWLTWSSFATGIHTSMESLAASETCHQVVKNRSAVIYIQQMYVYVCVSEKEQKRKRENRQNI